MKKIVISWQDLYELIKKYSSEIFDDLPNISQVEILLGGDHGKGAMNFVAVIIVRYKLSEINKPKIIELQIGQVDHSKDTMELLKVIVSKITPGINLLGLKDGESVVYVRQIEDLKLFQICNKEEVSEVGVRINYFLIGDLKFLFMMLDRDGYSGNQCLHWKLFAKDWKEKYADGQIQCSGEVWTIEKLLQPFLAAQINRQSASTASQETRQDSISSVSNRWQKEAPLWTFIPMENVIIPVLHLLLGLGNDVFDNFWSAWFDERVEPLTPEEVESRHMVLLAEISVEDSESRAKNAEDKHNELDAMRIEINKTLKEKGLDALTKQHLNEQKQEILSRLDNAKNEQDLAQKELSERKSASQNAKRARASKETQ